MTEEYAAEYLGWNYSSPYDFYNIPEENRQECMEEIKGAIDNWFAVVDDSGMLKGFYEFSFHEEQGRESDGNRSGYAAGGDRKRYGT